MELVRNVANLLPVVVRVRCLIIFYNIFVEFLLVLFIQHSTERWCSVVNKVMMMWYYKWRRISRPAERLLATRKITPQYLGLFALIIHLKLTNSRNNRIPTIVL
jgi:hypothetical protein